MLREAVVNDIDGPDPHPLCSTAMGCGMFILVLAGWSAFTILQVNNWDNDHPATPNSNERTLHSWNEAPKPHPQQPVPTPQAMQNSNDDDEAYGGGNFALLPPEYYLNNTHKYYCFYHSSLDRLEVAGTVYGLSIFPYHLCTHAVFCCTRVHLYTQQIKDEDEAHTFSPLLKTRNPYIKTLVSISGRPSLSMMDNSWLFIDNLVRWLLELKYDGAVLQWVHPLSTPQIRSRYQDFIDSLSRRFVKENLSLCMVIDAVRTAPDTLDIGDLHRVLRNYSMLVYPMAREPPLAQSDGFEEKSAVLYERKRLTVVLQDLRAALLRYHPNVTSNYKLCYIISFSGASYKFWNRNRTGVEEIVYGPGDPGPSTKTPGALGYYEICNEVWATSSVFEYGVVSQRYDTWVSHLSEFVVPALARHIHESMGGRCFGAWDLHLDDFAGVCGRGPYPLMRKLFGLFEDRS